MEQPSTQPPVQMPQMQSIAPAPAPVANRKKWIAAAVIIILIIIAGGVVAYVKHMSDLQTTISQDSGSLTDQDKAQIEASLLILA